MPTGTSRDPARAFLRRYPPARGNGVPKHAALRDAVAAAIADGFWAPGTKLPTEAHLAAVSPYSLGTVQRALRGLVEQGLVERRRGYGTYVADRRRELNRPWHCRFLSDDGKSFLPVFTVVLKRAQTRRHGPWSAALEQGDEAVIQIDRRMEVNKEFIVYSKFFARPDRCPELLDAPEESLSGANLKELIVRAAGKPLTALKEELQPVELPAGVCRAIHVKRGTHGLLVQATAYAGQSAVYYQELFIPPTRRRLYIESRVPPQPWA